MNELIPREPMFPSPSDDGQSKVFWLTAPFTQGWSVRSIFNCPGHDVQSAFTSSDEPDTQPS